MSLKRIHVNQHVIKKNRKTGEREPPLTVKTWRSNVTGSRVTIIDDKGVIVASIRYSPDKPLDCGAHVWIETHLDCFVDGQIVV